MPATPPPTPLPTPTRTCLPCLVVVWGHVYDIENLEPLAGASVHLDWTDRCNEWHETKFADLSGDYGDIFAPSGDSGQGAVTASAAGYQTDVYYFTDCSASLNLDFYLDPVGAEPSEGLILDARLFLEGPYSGGSMSTALLNNEYLPLTSPYDDERAVAEVPSGAVDWVFIQLRETPSGEAVSERSAFLKSDGYLRDDNGLSPVLMPMPAEGPGDYYIVIHHRNHLDIMSYSHTLSENSATKYDFTANYYATWGGYDAVKALGEGFYGMITGDADGDGVIGAADRGVVFNQRGRIGYRFEDVDLDGVVGAADRGLVFNNRGRVSLAP